MIQFLGNIDPYSLPALALTLWACVLLAIQIVCNALDQAHIWARRGRPESKLLRTFRPHLVDSLQEAGYYTFALMFGNPFAVWGMGMMMRIPFEGIINVGVGRSFWDQGSEEKDFVVRVRDWELYRRPKLNSAFGLVVQGVVGFILLVFHIPLTKLVHPLLHDLIAYL